MVFLFWPFKFQRGMGERNFESEECPRDDGRRIFEVTNCDLEWRRK